MEATRFEATAFEAPAYAQELAAAARYAQKLAVTSGCPVNFSVTAAGYALTQAQSTPPPCTGALVMTLPAKHPATGENFTGTVTAGVSIGGTLGTVQVSAAGLPSAAASYTIVDLSVTVAAGSGYVEEQ